VAFAHRLYQPQNNAYSPGNAEDGNGFITKYSPGGSSYVYSTYLGASVITSLSSIAVGADDKVYVTGLFDALPGSSGTSNYPVTPDAFEITGPATNSATAVFTVLDATGRSLAYSTLFTGQVPYGAYISTQSVAVTPDGQSAFLAGTVNNQTWRLTVSPQTNRSPHSFPTRIQTETLPRA
jgi:hypothetical protein